MTVLPCPLYPALATHASMAVLPANAPVFCGQDVHTEAEFAASTAEYVPTAQLVHTVAPVVAEYVPATQLIHTVELLAPTVPEYDPVRQSVHPPEPTAEYFPAPQFEHVVVPPGEAFPATHCVHVPPLDPVKPALQEQAVLAVLEPGEFEFPGQSVHDPEPAAEYFPAPQFEHVVVPPGEAVPAPH